MIGDTGIRIPLAFSEQPDLSRVSELSGNGLWWVHIPSFGIGIRSAAMTAIRKTPSQPDEILMQWRHVNRGYWPMVTWGWTANVRSAEQPIVSLSSISYYMIWYNLFCEGDATLGPPYSSPFIQPQPIEPFLIDSSGNASGATGVVFPDIEQSDPPIYIEPETRITEATQPLNLFVELQNGQSLELRVRTYQERPGLADPPAVTSVIPTDGTAGSTEFLVATTSFISGWALKLG